MSGTVLNVEHVHLPCARRSRDLGLTLVLATLGLPAVAVECDASLGAEAFASKCAACHSLEAGQHMTGPSLHELAGRRAGTVSGFNFSAAMSESGIVWSSASLEAFLTSPQTYVRGTVMPFGGVKNATERAAIVCYLVTS
jgi:cytochrome c